MLGRRRAATTGTPLVTTLPQGTWAPWTATTGSTTAPGSGQNLGGLVGLPRYRLHCMVQRVAAVPQAAGRVELEPTQVLLGVDHEHPTGADHQVVEVRPTAG